MIARVMDDNNPEPDAVPASVTADGGCRLKNPSTVGGMWAYRHVHESGRVLRQAYGVVLVADVFPLTTVTNNLTETLALLLALEAVPEGWSGMARTDSQNAIRVFQNPTKDRDHLTADLLARCRAARARLGSLTFELLAGHPTRAEVKRLEAGEAVQSERGYPFCLHNVWADEACRTAWHEWEARG